MAWYSPFQRSRTPTPLVPASPTWDRPSFAPNDTSNSDGMSLNRLETLSPALSSISRSTRTSPPKGSYPRAPSNLSNPSAENLVFENLRESDTVWKRPEPDQLAETLQVVMMNKSIMDPLPAAYNAAILHVLEAFDQQRNDIAMRDAEIERMKEEHWVEVQEWKRVAAEWEAREADARRELKERMTGVTLPRGPQGLGLMMPGRDLRGVVSQEPVDALSQAREKLVAEIGSPGIAQLGPPTAFRRPHATTSPGLQTFKSAPDHIVASGLSPQRKSRAQFATGGNHFTANMRTRSSLGLSDEGRARPGTYLEAAAYKPLPALPPANKYPVLRAQQSLNNVLGRDLLSRDLLSRDADRRPSTATGAPPTVPREASRKPSTDSFNGVPSPPDSRKPSVASLTDVIDPNTDHKPSTAATEPLRQAKFSFDAGDDDFMSSPHDDPSPSSFTTAIHSASISPKKLAPELSSKPTNNNRPSLPNTDEIPFRGVPDFGGYRNRNRNGESQLSEVSERSEGSRNGLGSREDSRNSVATVASAVTAIRHDSTTSNSSLTMKQQSGGAAMREKNRQRQGSGSGNTSGNKEGVGEAGSAAMKEKSGTGSLSVLGAVREKTSTGNFSVQSGGAAMRKSSTGSLSGSQSGGQSVQSAMREKNRQRQGSGSKEGGSEARSGASAALAAARAVTGGAKRGSA